MFSPPWGPPSPFDLHTYLARRSKSRHPRPEPHHYAHLPRSHSFPRPPWHANPPYGMKPHYPSLPKQTRFSHLHNPSVSDFSSPDQDDTYTLDTDTDIDHLPPRRTYPTHRAPRAPALETVSFALPVETASTLSSTTVLFLPPLVHLHILIYFQGGGQDELRAAVPGGMFLRDITQQVVRCYVGEGIGYAVRVEQRGRMQDVPRDAVVEDLAHRGEVGREGRREMEIEIVVVGDGDGRGRGERFDGRGARAGAQVETVREREVSRTRYARA